jgi:hypothetical protein
MVDRALFDKQAKAFDKLEAAFKSASDAWEDFSSQTAKLGKSLSYEYPEAALWCALLNPARARQLLSNDIGLYPRGFFGVNEALKKVPQLATEGAQDLMSGNPKKFKSMRSRLEEQRARLFAIIYPKETPNVK